jgi:hypothetical protein
MIRFVYGIHSRALLKITKGMAQQLLSFHQVMPQYLDFLLLFGQSSGPNDMKFSGFREYTCIHPTPPAAVTAANTNQLGRSNRYIEIAYNLKTVNLKDPDDEGSWSVRQAGIYHAFDLEERSALWMITKGLSRYDGSHDLKSRIEEITGTSGREEDRKFDSPANSFRSTLAIHALVIHWASEEWRWYLQWLDERIEYEVRRRADKSESSANIHLD